MTAGSGPRRGRYERVPRPTPDTRPVAAVRLPLQHLPFRDWRGDFTDWLPIEADATNPTGPPKDPPPGPLPPPPPRPVQPPPPPR